MSTLPTFDSVNNVKVFNGSSQYLQIAPTNINLANGIAIATTFTPTATAPVSGETLCSLFQQTTAANSINIARVGTSTQFAFNFVNSGGIVQNIPLGNFITGNTYQLLVQSYVNATNTGASFVTQNQSAVTMYVGSSLISSITAYPTSAVVNFTTSGFAPLTPPLQIYLYNTSTSTWTAVGTATALASGSALVTTNMVPAQTGVYRLALTVISDAATYANYNTTQAVYTAFNTPALPVLGAITPQLGQFSVGAVVSYPAVYVSSTAITYTAAPGPAYTAFNYSAASTLGNATAVTVGGSASLAANAQYKIRMVLADPASTVVLSAPVYTLATVSFVATPITPGSTAFAVTWNASGAGTPAVYYYSVNITVKLTAAPYTQVYTGSATAASGITTRTFNAVNSTPPIAPNTGYTVSLAPVNGDLVINTAMTYTSTTTYAVTLSASAAATSYSSMTVSWTATAGATVFITSTPALIAQAYATSPVTVTGMTAGTSYSFAVAAINSAAAVNPAPGDAMTATASTYVLGTVTAPRATAVTYNSMSVGWTYGGSYPAVTAAMVYISRTTSIAGATQSRAITLGQAQPVLFSSTGAGASYYIIITVAAGIYAPATTVVSATTFTTLALGTLGVPTPSAINYNSTGVNWTYGGPYPATTAATVYISPTTSTVGATAQQAITLGQTQPVTVAGLTPATAYYIIVFVAAGAYGPDTTAVSAVTFTTYSVDTLVSPAVASFNYNSVAVNWSYSATAGYLPMMAATIYVSTTTDVAASVAQQRVTLGHAQPVSVTGLTPATTYYVIIAVDGGPTSNGTYAVSFTTYSLQALVYPAIAYYNYNYVNVNWSYSVAAGYLTTRAATIYVSTSSTIDAANVVSQQAITLGQTQPVKVGGLNYSTLYYIIIAVDAGGPVSTGVYAPSFTTYSVASLVSAFDNFLWYNKVILVFDLSAGQGYTNNTMVTLYLSSTPDIANQITSRRLRLGDPQPEITGLTPATSYYSIVAVDGGPTTDGVNAYRFTTYALGTLGVPTTAAATSNGISVYWSYGGGYPDTYGATIYISTTTSIANQVVQQSIALNQAQPLVFATGLTPATAYYAIIYVDASYYGPITSNVSAQFTTTA